jgi:hypothetical protein
MKFVKIVIGLILFLILPSIAAGDRVVVIPLHSSVKKMKNIVTVSADGGDFTDPVAAMDSITDASAANPYLVFIGPGVYHLSKSLVMKEFVDLMGAGQGVTILTGTISSADRDEDSALIVGAANTTLQDMTVENKGGSAVSIAAYYDVTHFYKTTKIVNMTFLAQGGTDTFGVLLDSGLVDMKDITVTARDGSASNQGVYDYSSDVVTLRNIDVQAFSGNNTATNSALYNYVGSYSIIIGADVVARGGAHSYGCNVERAGMEITHARINAEGAPTGQNIAFFSHDHSAYSKKIKDAQINGASESIRADDNAVSVFHSSVYNGVNTVGSSGTMNCLYCDNGFNKLDDTCN